jgi:hypothetical protein
MPRDASVPRLKWGLIVRRKGASSGPCGGRCLLHGGAELGSEKAGNRVWA